MFGPVNICLGVSRPIEPIPPSQDIDPASDVELEYVLHTVSLFVAGRLLGLINKRLMDGKFLSNSKRVTAIDATRGLAMLAVCVAHFGEDILDLRRTLGYGFINFGHIATPLFLLLSGTIVGHLTSVTRESRARFSARLIDRGIFVMVVGHLLLAAGYANSLVRHHTWSASLFRSIYITDVIGLGLCISGLLWLRLEPTRRSLMAASMGLYALSWTIAMLNNQFPSALRLPMAIIFGAADTTGMGIEYAVPVLPYLAIILAGQALGQFASPKLSDSQNQLKLGKKLLWWGVCATTLALGIKIGWSIVQPGTGNALLTTLNMTLSPVQKIPPGPNYLLFYGGAGIALLGLVLIVAARSVATRLIDSLAVVGRASFGLFVFQFFMYAVVIAGLPPPVRANQWWLCLTMSIIVLWCVAAVWDHINGNRWFTVGLRPILLKRLAPID